MNWPYQAQRGVEDGHQICLHTWSHHYMTSFDDEGAFAELYYPIKVSLRYDYFERSNLTRSTGYQSNHRCHPNLLETTIR